MKRRLARLGEDVMLALRGWRTQRRLRAETASNLLDTVAALKTRVDELEYDLDELRADSRRVAELRIQVEDLLADRT